MKWLTNWIRKYIGVVFSLLGFFLLIALTFGNIVDVFTKQYWLNVYDNAASIGMLSVALVFIQTMIKQGISEQALSTGLNTPDTKKKYEEHRGIMKRCNGRIIYLPYFLDMRNLRETTRRKKDFLINNRFIREKDLLNCDNKKLIRQYNAISTNIRVKDVRWSSTETVTDEYGRIETLSRFRRSRLIKGIATGAGTMLFTTLIARELFKGADSVDWGEKFLQLAVYVITIAISVIPNVLKNYEKGAFGIQNDLDEINSIWEEFEQWEIPQYVIDEVETVNKTCAQVEVMYEQKSKNATDSGTILQEKPKEVQNTQTVSPDSELDVSRIDDAILLPCGAEQPREHIGDNKPAE